MHNEAVQNQPFFAKHQPCGDRWECLFLFTSAAESKPDRQLLYLQRKACLNCAKQEQTGPILSAQWGFCVGACLTCRQSSRLLVSIVGQRWRRWNIIILRLCYNQPRRPLTWSGRWKHHIQDGTRRGTYLNNAFLCPKMWQVIAGLKMAGGQNSLFLPSQAYKTQELQLAAHLSCRCFS